MGLSGYGGECHAVIVCEIAFPQGFFYSPHAFFNKSI